MLLDSKPSFSVQSPNRPDTPKLSTNTMTTEYKFEGWMGLGPEASEGKMVWQEFEPKPWEETDVDIKITHCGICGTDLHTLRSGWVSLSASKPPTSSTISN